MVILVLLGILVGHISFANSFYLDKSEIKIDVAFSGDEINLYGIKSQEGQVIIIFKGEKATYYLQKKEKKFGIWVKGEKKKFDNIYRYYAIKSESSLDSIRIPHLIKSFEIGLENISTYTDSIDDTLEMFEFKNALIRYNINHSLFYEDFNAKIVGIENLLYAKFQIPENIPEGRYLVSIYIINNGEIVSIYNIPVYVRQVGILKFVKITSQEKPWLYFALSIFSSIGIACLGYIVLSGKIKRITIILWQFFYSKIYRKNKKIIKKEGGKKRGRPRKNASPKT